MSVVALLSLYFLLYNLHNTTVNNFIKILEGFCVGAAIVRISEWVSNQFGEDNGYREEDQESHSDTEEPGDSNSL